MDTEITNDSHECKKENTETGETQDAIFDLPVDVDKNSLENSIANS